MDNGANGSATLESRVTRLELQLDDYYAKLLAEVISLKQMILETRQDVGQMHADALAGMRTLQESMPKRRVKR